MKTIASYRRWFGLLRICLSKVIFGLIPKDRTLILFNSWFGDKYADALKTRVFNNSYEDKDRIRNKDFKTGSKKDYKPEVRYKEKKKSRKSSN